MVSTLVVVVALRVWVNPAFFEGVCSLRPGSEVLWSHMLVSLAGLPSTRLMLVLLLVLATLAIRLGKVVGLLILLIPNAKS